jgi:hypothetical protein
MTMQTLTRKITTIILDEADLEQAVLQFVVKQGKLPDHPPSKSLVTIEGSPQSGYQAKVKFEHPEQVTHG